MVHHTVVFKLKHPVGSSQAKAFLDAALELSAIPGVRHFECLLQTSKKNNFDYGISMEFDTKKAYDDYSKHPDHVAFVQTFWLRDVADFLEIDYEPMK